ncbi:MAG: glutaredoxin family protein [Alphaproteobacteria bacterium]|nr:glutaredoxin family protein [Alphaproteobacteria bacterium]
MKKFIGIALIGCSLVLGLFTFGCDSSVHLDAKMVYFFTKPGCPYCEKAEDYIKQMHPNLSVEYKNVKENSARALMLACAEKFNLPTNKLGTPLICMGDNYLLGWGDGASAKFEKALKALQ